MPELIDDSSFTIHESRLIDLPHDSLILSRGLLALILIIVGFAIGLVFAKTCMDYARIALATYQSDPDMYNRDSLARVKRGKLLATIGLGIFALEVILLIYCVYFVDWE